MTTTVVVERPDTEDATTLIAELDAQLEPLYPRASRHGYDVDKLLREGVAFFVIRHDRVAAGCGGVQLFGPAYGEVKRMYVHRFAVWAWVSSCSVTWPRMRGNTGSDCFAWKPASTSRKPSVCTSAWDSDALLRSERTATIP